MAIQLADVFNFQAPFPGDLRHIKSDLNGRNSIGNAQRYIGLEVYVISEDKKYRLVGGTTNSDWVEIGQGGSGGVATSSLLIGADPVINWNATAVDSGGNPVTDSWAQLYGNTPTVQVWLETSPNNYSLEVVPVTMTLSGGNIQTVNIDTSGISARIIIK